MHPQPKPIVYLELLAACVIFILIIFTLPENLPWSLRATVGITGASVWFTTLGKRFANYSIIRFGGSIHGVLLGVLLAPQILSIFIPATEELIVQIFSY